MDDNPTYNELEQKVKESENEVAKLKELEKHWQILSSAIDGSSEGMAIIDLDGNLHYLNSAFAEVHGYSVNDLLGKHFSIFHTQQQMPSVKAANRQVKEKGTFIGEIWHTRRDGTVFPTIMHNSLIRDEEEKPVYFLGTLRDISEQKKLEEDLRKERDKSQHYLNIAGVILVAIDTEQNVVMINKKGCEILGYEEHEIVGKKWFNRFVKAKEAKEIRSVFNQIISGKIEVAEYHENAILTKYCEERIIAWHNSLVRDESGRIIGTLSSGEDITERKLAVEALKKTNEILEQKVKERTAELKERNIALKVLLDQRKNDKERLEKTIMLNIKKLINPNLARLKKSPINDRQKTELAILEANLDEIISPFESSLSSEYLKLTPTEMQVANFIKHGATSPEIASSLKLSRRTVDTHRYNIRKKIGIRGKDVNLKTYLSSHT